MTITDTDSTEKNILDTLNAVAADGDREHWPPREWTRQIKLRLAALAEARALYPCCTESAAPDGQGEWLYDLVWLDLRDGRIVAVPPILECEWATSPKAIRKDFQKLIVGRAEHRVMIFQQVIPAGVHRVIDRLQDDIYAFQPGLNVRDRYLFAGWDARTRTFTYRVLTS